MRVGPKRILVAGTALVGFLGVWLGLPLEVEPSGRTLASITGSHLVDSISLNSAQATPEASPSVSPSPIAEVGGTVSTVTKRKKDEDDSCLPRSALDDVTNRRKALEKREAELTAKESDLATREKAVQEELKKIQLVRAEIEKVQGSRSAENEEKVAHTVEVLEAMNPKAASQLVSSYDERLAVSVMAKMSTPKLSKILNVMDPKRSTRLMELMAGTGTPAVSSVGNVPNENAVKK